MRRRSISQLFLTHFLTLLSSNDVQICILRERSGKKLGVCVPIIFYKFNFNSRLS